jgi:hypothetical protein
VRQSPARIDYLVGFGSALGWTVEPEQQAPQQLPQLQAINDLLRGTG